VRYLITGGAGFIGSALVRQLREHHYVAAFDDLSRGNLSRLDSTTEVFVGDIRDQRAVDAAVSKSQCDAVLHLAMVQGTQTFYSKPKDVQDVAIRGICNVLSACEVAGVRDLMLVSSSEAYQVAPVVPTPEDVPLSIPDPLNPRYSYGGGKIASEMMAIAYQQGGALDRLIIARPHNVYGPDMGREHVIPEFALRMKALSASLGVIPFPIQGTGLETRSFCYIDDAVAALALLLEAAPAGASIWNVGTQDERTVSDVAHAVGQCFGRTIEVHPGKLPEGSPPRRCPDTSKIEALGYRAKVPFAQGITRAVEWYKRND